MMNEPIRRPDQISPKSSPRGSRSPAYPRPDSSGTLRTTISLGRVPSVIHSGPFYLVKDMGSGTANTSEMTGSNNLIIHYDLEHSYSKFCKKEGKEELSAFLPNLPGYIDAPSINDNSSLRSLIEKPPIVGKELNPLSSSSLSGFRLHPGPLPEQYRFMNQMPKKKPKPKRKKPDKNSTLQDYPDNAGEGSHDKKKNKTRTDAEKTEKQTKRKKKKKKKVKEKEEESQS